MPERALGEHWPEFDQRGWLGADAFASRGLELAAVRAVARGGLGAGRVFDGHRNAVERLLEHRPDDVAPELRAEVASGSLRLGVWGADPGPADGTPACLDPGGQTVTGVKTFCSGAGHVDAAIVLVRREFDGPPILPVLLDVRDTGRAQVDTGWFVSPVLAESHSHRVEFAGAPVLAVLGTEGTLTEDPWFSGDALRSSAVWAGAADVLVERMAAAGRDDDAALEALGRATAILGTVDAWLAAGARAVDAAHEDGSDPWPVIAALRLELTERLRELLRLSAEHLGSRGLVTDDAFHEARSGLDVLLLQHRLAPAAVRLGRQAHRPAVFA